jgi:Domain of unknown function (DUF4262)
MPSDFVPGGRDHLDDIAANGVQLVHVAEDDDHPSWSFTLGLWQRAKHPEVVVFGLPAEVADDLLNVIADDVEDGNRFAAGDTRDDILDGYQVYFGRVHPSQCRGLLDEIHRVYESHDVPVIQLVYPDKQGRWPWNPDVREGFAAVQPVLERIGDAAGDAEPAP